MYWKQHIEKVILILILILAIIFRWNNLNWDANQHLHPDERFLTMVGNAMKMPSTLHDYLNPQTSTFNPVNIGYPFYVYGTFPVVLNKVLAIYSGYDDYNGLTLQGRALSAIADIVIVLFVYRIAKLLFSHKKEQEASSIALWASFFYTIAVVPIQLAHFFAVDTFVTLFTIASIYFALLFFYAKGIENVFLSGLMWGLAVACKISALYAVPLILAIIVLRFWHSEQHKTTFFKLLTYFLKHLPFSLGSVLLYFVTAYITLRFANPYYFADSNFFHVALNDTFVQNIKSLEGLMNKEVWFPPMVQWFNKTPVVFSVVNIIFFGLGVPLAMLSFVGFLFMLRKELQTFISTRYTKISVLLVILLWSIFFFLYQSLQLTQTLRYFIFLYPFFCIFAAVAVYYLLVWLEKRVHKVSLPRKKLVFTMTKVLIIVLVLIWPVAFSRIYHKPHSRVQASEWMYNNIEPQKVILYEHWDDALPLNLEGKHAYTYSIRELPVFGEDTDAKWENMNKLLAEADYYVLSSNRGWGSITTVPERYPRMSKFYDDLLQNKTDYKLIQEFTSHPQICVFFDKMCLTFDDQWAEESFTVYDHPQVLLFKRMNNAN